MKYTIKEMQDHAALCATLEASTDDHFEGKSGAIIDQLLSRIEAMEKDAEFLNWIADRIVHVYGESNDVDFLIKLRSIVAMQSEKGGV